MPRGVRKKNRRWADYSAPETCGQLLVIFAVTMIAGLIAMILELVGWIITWVISLELWLLSTWLHMAMNVLIYSVLRYAIIAGGFCALMIIICSWMGAVALWRHATRDRRRYYPPNKKW